MIKAFKCADTEKLFNQKRVKRFVNIEKSARKKLEMIEAATNREDLRSPPGNHLEELKGNRVGQSSIMINDPWRICFVFKDGDAYEVEITDYH